MSTRRPNASTKKKKCQGQCGKERAETFFFKVDSPLFPDGRINICRDCVRAQVDVKNIEEVISFLRQIDKPFVESYWNEAVQSGKHPLGEYIRKINSLPQMKGKTFNNSDNMNGVGKTSDIVIRTATSIANVKGEIIEYSEELVDKWGIGYKPNEILKMEKFYQDMRLTHEIHTPVHVNKLMELAYLQIESERLRQERDIPNYTKLATAIEKMEQSAGFRPVDRQGIDDATGIKSFSQIFEEVEKRGFRKPPAIEFEEDIVDAMIIALGNYYNRLVGKQLLAELPEDIQRELDEFYELDETPVELNDEEYEDMDFSVTDDEDELDG
ncbi:hypothetical protein AB3N02_22485 [Priestia aryabhattai]|uniref:hypothetical protein n=1 Tax=Priestia aryabhattai TaxID=412384 RepID=UPI0039A0DD77